MNTLIFATNNKNKVVEIRSLLSDNFKILSLEEAGINIDIPEPFDTLKANAIEKASVIFRLKHTICFAEDTGLHVEALNGEPGVRSARYAGEGKSSEQNIDKILLKMDGITNRNASFKTVICLAVEGKHNIFEGQCRGSIINERKGSQGFGYDSIFVPENAAKTFAEMDLKEKIFTAIGKKLPKN